AIAAVAAFALAIAPAANAADKGCSNATLKGTFVHTASGFVTAPPSAAGPFAAAGVDTFDGKTDLNGWGGATSTAALNLNGPPVFPPVQSSGTYKVNTDCTGTYKISALGGTTTLFFVIGDNGNEIQAICVDPGPPSTLGSVVRHTLRRQIPVGDWRE